MLQLRILACLLILSVSAGSQTAWRNIDSAYGPLPASVHVYFSDTKMDTGSFKAYYIKADLKDKSLAFTTDTTQNRRLTPAQFYQKADHPCVVVNATFFSFETNRNLNLVIRKGRLLAYNRETLPGRGKDTFTYRHVFTSALGITADRKADVAWTFTDSSKRFAYAFQSPVAAFRDSTADLSYHTLKTKLRNGSLNSNANLASIKKWKVQTAVGGGPVLVQNGEIKVTNNEELKFAGKALYDKHPRTAMGYTADGFLIILAVQGRSESSGGATLTQEAQLLKELGCVEALNLDGGGSSCLLINGKETIKPSDKEGERPVPGVFLIRTK